MSRRIGMDTPERIDAYLDDELAAEERSAFETEIERSVSLRQALEEREGLDHAIRALPPVEVSPQFEAHFRARLARAEDRQGWRGLLVRARTWAGVFAGPAVAAVALALLVGNPSLPEADWALITDADAFELILEEDPNLLAALDVLESWNPSEVL